MNVKAALIGFVAAGSLLCGGVAYRIWPQPPALPHYDAGQPGDRSYRAGGHECEIAHLSSIRERWKRFRKEDACAEKAEAEQLQRDNLIQTARSADAAEAQATLAYQASWNGFFQTIAGILTFFAAGAASVFAWLAAHHTKRGADAATDTIKRIDSAQRPWIAVSVQVGTGLVQRDGMLRIPFDVSFKNTGDTHAENVTIAVTSGLGDSEGNPPKDKLWEIDIRSAPGGIAIMPGETLSYNSSIFYDTEALNWRLEAGIQVTSIYVFTAAAYRAAGSDRELHTGRTYAIGVDEKVDYYLSTMIPKAFMDNLSKVKLITRMKGYAKTQ